VVEALSALVERGQRGDRLPAERELAFRLGVGRAAIRHALSALDAAELISKRPQVGSFIC
jgi:GntR family transcriptional repressor for pyruvate dehydrogenase complex